jgi:hypothetical protein
MQKVADRPLQVWTSFGDGLKDVDYAENRIVKALPKMKRISHNPAELIFIRRSGSATDRAHADWS